MWPPSYGGVVVVGAAGPGVVAAAARTPTQLPAVRRLGLDETRARSLRWAFDPDIVGKTRATVRCGGRGDAIPLRHG